MRWIKRNEGSMTLEAAIILPFFITFLLFLITMIRIALVDIALHHMVTEASKEAASQMYLVQLAYDQIQDTELGEFVDRMGKHKENIDKAMKSVEERLKNADKILQKFENILPSEIIQILRLPSLIQDGFNGAYHSALGQLVKPYVIRHADQRVLDAEQLYITKVLFPNFKELDQPYVGFEIRYDLPLYLPFLDMTLSFQHQAYERAWIGDYFHHDRVSENPYLQDPFEDSPLEEGEEDERIDSLHIHSISSPVQRGRSVRIIAKGPPDQTATISLYYQSGFEKEVSCTSDSTGWFHCDIRIGGNSKEGEFEAVMQIGHLEDRAGFIVLSKDNMQR